LSYELTYKEVVKGYLERKGRTTEIVLPVLEEIQEKLGFIPRGAIEYLAEILRISPSVIYSTATFYHFFSLEPKGEIVLRVCRGTACHVMGSSLIMGELFSELGLEDEGTTPDGKFTVESVGCIGCCSTGPNMVIIKDGKEEIVGHLTPMKAREIIRSLRKEVSESSVGVE